MTTQTFNPSELVLERRGQVDKTPVVGNALITPPINEDYWAYRVRLSDKQAIVGFPKFGTVGIGFAVEDEDWNANLPYSSDAEEIARHIADNKGDESITDALVIAAIRLVQAAAAEDRQES